MIYLSFRVKSHQQIAEECMCASQALNKIACSNKTFNTKKRQYCIAENCVMFSYLCELLNLTHKCIKTNTLDVWRINIINAVSQLPWECWHYYRHHTYVKKTCDWKFNMLDKPHCKITKFSCELTQSVSPLHERGLLWASHSGLSYLTHKSTRTHYSEQTPETGDTFTIVDWIWGTLHFKADRGRCIICSHKSFF